MLQACRFEVAEQLRNLFVRQGFCALQIHNQLVLDQQVRSKLPDDGAILIHHLYWMLLLDVQTRFPPPGRIWSAPAELTLLSGQGLLRPGHRV